jgi:uncharacterized protein
MARNNPEPRMRELVEYVARSLVDNPDEVVVREHRSGYRYSYHLTVNEEDMGRVIGKQGKIAQALRTLLKVGATRSDVRANLEIGE